MPAGNSPSNVNVAILTSVFRVEVRDTVFPIVHADYDAEEDGDNREILILHRCRRPPKNGRRRPARSVSDGAVRE